MMTVNPVSSVKPGIAPRFGAGNVIDLTTANFDQEVLQATTPVVVDFWATWCGPCKQLTPVMQNLANHYGNKVKVTKVNIDNEPGLAQRFGISSIPTVLVFNNGVKQATMVGLQGMAGYQKVLNPLVP